MILIVFLLIMCVSGCSPVISTAITEPSSIGTSIPTQTVTPAVIITSTPEISLDLSTEITIHDTDQLLMNGDYDLAWMQYNNILITSSNTDLIAESLWGLARVEFLRNYYDQSLIYVENLQTNYPESPEAQRSYYLQGQNYYELGLFSDSANAFNNYLTFNPETIDSHVQERIGDSLANNGDYQEALNAYISSSLSGEDSFTLDIKIAKMHKALGDYSSSIEIYQEIFNQTDDDYLKAQMVFLIGQVYYSQGLFDNAYPYFLDAVTNYPASYDSYSSLVALVNDGIEVDDFNRGLVNYFVGNLGNALSSFDQYLIANPDHDGSVIHYKALSLRAQGEYQLAIDQWSILINEYPTNRYWDTAWDEKAYTLWGYLDNYQEGAQTLLDYASTYPTRPNAPYYLNSAARILERGGFLEDASSTWEKLSTDYPESELVPDALFNAGIVLYRMKNYKRALVTFQKDLIFSISPSNQARAFLWIGKSQLASGDLAGAQQSYQLAAGIDPTDYYSLRAQDLLTGQDGLTGTGSYDFKFNFDEERSEAETWIRITFQLPPTLNLKGLGELIDDERIAKGTEFWRLGLFNEATNEFDNLFLSIRDNPEMCFRFANYLQDIGFHRLAINSFRQVLRLGGMETYTQMLNAPDYFKHMNYGAYFQDLIVDNAEDYNIDPILLMSIIAQESAFDIYINSTAGAVGLMQIMPSTGDSIANSLNWPVDYSSKDLIRPMINIQFGTAYLAMNRNYFDGNIFQTLAAYNAGPGNVDIWRELSGNDLDLFLEVIRFAETRNYLENIYEIFSVYHSLYGSN